MGTRTDPLDPVRGRAPSVQRPARERPASCPRHGIHGQGKSRQGTPDPIVIHIHMSHGPDAPGPEGNHQDSSDTFDFHRLCLCA